MHARLGDDGVYVDYAEAAPALEKHIFILGVGTVVAEIYRLNPNNSVINRRLLEAITADAATKEMARDAAGVFVFQHKGVILRLAFYLFDNRVLDADTAKQIVSGEIIPEASEDFMDALYLLPSIVWAA
jgi:hypothetical protein